MKKVKRKKPTVSKLKKKLWKVFTLYIKNRDKWTCFTCGRQAKGAGMHSGHYIAKSVGGLALYFHEKNVNAQCYHCNIDLSGNSDVYIQKLIGKYGEEVIDEIRLLRQEITKWTIQDYEEKILFYQDRLK